MINSTYVETAVEFKKAWAITGSIEILRFPSIATL